jgi:predicted aminopeptidase
LIRRAGWVLALVVVVTVAGTRTGRYLARAAWSEMKILHRRRPIPAVIADPSISALTRGKLRLVLEAREFASDSLGLSAGASFTTFAQLDGDTLVLVLSGARRDALERVSWWFPVVGRVPYKGFFDTREAISEARRMARDGYDPYLRPASAFSTLGWFNDPLLSSTLRDDSIGLAETVIHELTHGTYYAPGSAVFNESFANFAGAQGAVRFFESRGDTVARRKAEARWADERALSRFYGMLYNSLDSAFSAHPEDSLARLAARDSIYSSARRALIDSVSHTLHTIPLQSLERLRLDNATLLARRVYLTELDDFDAVLAAAGGNLPDALARILDIAAEQPDDPFNALRSHAARLGGG